MKIIYPVVISEGEKYFIASVPDCEIDTQGESVDNAIEMARDAIGLWCACEEEAKRSLPTPSKPIEISHEFGDIVTLVDVDLDLYRKQRMEESA